MPGGQLLPQHRLQDGAAFFPTKFPNGFRPSSSGEVEDHSQARLEAIPVGSLCQPNVSLQKGLEPPKTIIGIWGLKRDSLKGKTARGSGPGLPGTKRGKSCDALELAKFGT